MQLRQPSPDALVSFSDFLLERFGLAATMQVALVASVAFHALMIVGVGMRAFGVPKWDAPHNTMYVVLVRLEELREAHEGRRWRRRHLDGGGNTTEDARVESA
jgi:hypothetical protein